MKRKHLRLTTESNIYVPNFSESGYGDRVLDLLVLSIYSYSKQKNMTIYWKEFQGMEDYADIPSWRFKDTKLENIQSFFVFPDYITLKSTPIAEDKSETFDKYIGGTTSPHEFLSKYMNNSISTEGYNDIIKNVKSHFGFKIPKYVHSVPYVAIHLRRTDKMRGVCETQIVKSQLEFLNNETKNAIERAISKGFFNFFIASDDESSKQEFIDFIQSKNCNIFQPKNIHNLLESYYDTWILSSSSLIIPSMRYSTFSLFPALLFDVPLWYVLEECLYKKLNFHVHCNIQYYKDA
jgi:hypothetical protein